MNYGGERVNMHESMVLKVPDSKCEAFCLVFALLSCTHCVHPAGAPAQRFHFHGNVDKRRKSEHSQRFCKGNNKLRPFRNF